MLFRDPIGEETTWKRDALGRVRRTRLGDASIRFMTMTSSAGS